MVDYYDISLWASSPLWSPNHKYLIATQFQVSKIPSHIYMFEITLITPTNNQTARYIYECADTHDQNESND